MVVCVVIAGLSIALLLAACGSPRADTELSEIPKDGGVLREGLVTPVSSDPAQARTVSERVIAGELYDALTSWDPVSLTATPSLAERWEVSPERLHWTFYLRSSAKAADGQPVTASDVKASLEHIVRHNTNSPVSDVLAPVTGFAAAAESAQTDLRGIVVIDSRTVRIDLDKPFAELARALGAPNFGVVHTPITPTPTPTPVAPTTPATSIASPTTPATSIAPLATSAPSAIPATSAQIPPRLDPHCTGPFAAVLASAAVPSAAVTPAATTQMTPMHLVKNPGSNAHLDGIDVYTYSDVGAAYADFQAGKLDWSLLAPEQVGAAGQQYGRQLFRPSLRVLYLAFNLQSPKFTDVSFREAIMRALDRSAITRAIHDGDARALNGVAIDGLPDLNDSLCSGQCRFDSARAKTLLTAAFPNSTPPSITIDVSDGPPLSDDARKIITDELAAVGIAATLRTTPADQYQDVTLRPDRELFQLSWSAVYPSANAFLSPLFASTSPSNVMGYHDNKTDGHLDKASAAGDIDQQTSALDSAAQGVMSDYPVIPIAQFSVDSVERPGVHAILPLPTGNFDATTVWLTPASS